jgi:hypothetical protein
MPLVYHKASPASLRDLGFDERWLQHRILDDPSILGLGDVTVLQRERRQSGGGRLDFLLSEPESVATIIGVLSIPLSGLFIWLQLRQQTRLAKVANTQSLVELSSPFNLQLIQDPQMAEYWVHGAEKYQSFDPVEQYRYKSLLIWWLILHENIFFQWKSGLLDRAIYESWQYDLESFVLYQLRERWPDLKVNFQPDFVRHVEELVRKSHPKIEHA